jgi:uncharacterized membrane protein
MVQHGPGFAPIGFHLFGIVILFVLVAGAGVAALIVWAVRASGRPAYPMGAPPMHRGAPPPQAPRETPLEILARRFASGEITAEEYERGRDLLGGAGPKT